MVWNPGMKAQSWDYVKEKNGIRMYTRKQDSSSFKCFRGETVFNSSMEEVSKYIGVANNFDQWDENIEELTLLESTSNRYINCYFAYRTPWPLSKRDFCAELIVAYDSASHTRTVNATPMKKDLPERKGIVRVRNFYLRWTLTDMGSNKIHAVMEGFIDPGGLVPSWLYNLVIVQAPYDAMNGIKQRVEKEGI